MVENGERMSNLRTEKVKRDNLRYMDDDTNNDGMTSYQ